MIAGMPTVRHLSSGGGATWGATPAEAFTNLETVVKMVVASLAEHGEPIVEAAPSGSVEVSLEPLVAVTV
jgi:predicted RNase H-like HicB family nuclease